MAKAVEPLPDDVETLKAMVVAARAERLAAEVKACNAEAENHALALQVEKMKFEIARLRHER